MCFWENFVDCVENCEGVGGDVRFLGFLFDDLLFASSNCKCVPRNVLNFSVIFVGSHSFDDH